METTGVTVLPDAGRDEQLELWGLPHEHIGARVRGIGADDTGAESDDATESALEALGFLQDGGWHAVEPTKGTVRGEGTTSHRGVLHPDEYVDADALRAAVEAELGFTFDDVHGVYRRGRLSSPTLELRARIDARLLGLAQAGANIAALGRVLGFHIDKSGHCEALDNALARARKEHA